MAFLNWDEEHTLGVAAMDEQHRQLVQAMNVLYEALRAGRDVATTRQLLTELVEKVAGHFEAEEALMRSTSFPAYAEHKALHDDLLRQIVPLQREYLAGRARLGADNMVFLKEWLLVHTVKSDMVYAAYMSASDAKRRVA